MVTKLTKKDSISKFKVTLIRGIFRILKYSNVGRYLDPLDKSLKKSSRLRLFLQDAPF